MTLLLTASHYRDFPVDFTWAIEPGLAVYTGPSGSGKTSRHALLGLLQSLAKSKGVQERTARGQQMNFLPPPEWQPVTLRKGTMALAIDTGGRVWRVRVDFDEQEWRTESTKAPSEEDHPARLWAEHLDLEDVAEADLRELRKPWYDHNVGALPGLADRALFSTLRLWRDRGVYAPRYDFILQGMAKVVPGCEGFDFDSGWREGGVPPERGGYGNGRARDPAQEADAHARVFLRRVGAPDLPHPCWPEGWLRALLLLARVASMPSGGTLAIDNADTGLDAGLQARLWPHLARVAASEGRTLLLFVRTPTPPGAVRVVPLAP